MYFKGENSRHRDTETTEFIQMKCLFVVNILLSARTAGFWRRNRIHILEQFESPEVFYPESNSDLPAINLKEIETIIFVGDDSFFHWIVNGFYELLTENLGRTLLAFIPDSRHSALTDGLGLPRNLQKSVDLIKRKRTIPMDLIRCHYIDHHGFPSSCLVLNDVVIGLPPIKFPLVLENMTQWIKALPFARFRKNRKHISLLQDGEILFDGDYFFAILLLGRRITRGPKIGKRRRINLTRFEYLQVNTRSFRKLMAALPDILSGKADKRQPDVFYKRLSDLEIKGVSQDNKLIADGTHIGRLPASFTLLPKAVRVISPLITVKAKSRWKEKIASAKVPKPVGNREMADVPRNLKEENSFSGK